MKLEARRLPLALPYLVVGAEDSVAEEITDGGAEVVAFGEIEESRLEKILEVAWVRGDDAVKVGEPGSLESEGPVLPGENVGDPFIHVVAEADDQRRQHSDEGPVREAVALPLPQAVYHDEHCRGEEDLHGLDLGE